MDVVESSMLVIFFFQAEDGIRDLVRSRGLGDVYKRQGCGWFGGNGRTIMDEVTIRLVIAVLLWLAAAVLVVGKLVISLGHAFYACLLYTSPSPRDRTRSRMPSSA